MAKILMSLIFCILFAKLNGEFDRDHCKCRIKVANRVIGGRYSDFSDYAWLVSISDKLQKPGGVIINDYYILTSASAVLADKTYSVGYNGDNDLVKIYEKGRTYIKRRIIHPEYSHSEGINDIALIELETPLIFSDRVQPACLDTRFEYKDFGSNLMLAGYGVTSKVLYDPKNNRVIKSKPSRFLKNAEFQDVSWKKSSEKCQNDKGLICVDSQKENEASICYHDEGSPMHQIEAGRAKVIGIASGSFYAIEQNGKYLLCNSYGYLTRLEYYFSWIESYVNEAHC